MNNQDVFIGIDMGATHIRICVMDVQQQRLAQEKRKTEAIISLGLIEGMISFCEEFRQGRPIKRIVIGLPAAISADRKNVLSIPNISLPQSELVNLVSELSAYFRCSVALERDVNLQLIYDVAQNGLQDKLVIGGYLGTGLGFAIWHQQKLFTGENGVAGELGHIPYGDLSSHCNCGNDGCLETVCSGMALKHWFERQQFDFPLEDLFEKQVEHSFINAYLLHLAKAMGSVINLFDPHSLVLGGG